MPRKATSSDTVQQHITITSTMIERFELALREHESRPRPEQTHPLIWRAQREAMQSQLADLRRELSTWQQQLADA